MNERPSIKRFVKGIYSYAADKIYEPVVVRGAFRLFGGDLNSLVLAQGVSAVRLAGDGPILDMPVGTAYFTEQTAALHGGLVVGSDIAEGMVRESKRVARVRERSNLEVVQADAHRLPFRDGAFAVILCNNGLQVIPGLEPTLGELGRVLEPGGSMFVSVVGIPVSRALGPRAAEKMPALLRAGRDFVEPLKRAGFEVLSVKRERLAWLIEARRKT